jgi:hypothetical protein
MGAHPNARTLDLHPKTRRDHTSVKTTEIHLAYLSRVMRQRRPRLAPEHDRNGLCLFCAYHRGKFTPRSQEG